MNSGNMVSFVTETKLRSSIKSWIANKFESVHVFMSGLNKSFFSIKIAMIMNNSLAHYVSKIKKISGQIILIQLLFKGKLSVMVLSLYAGASPETKFGQALEVNSVIAKAINFSTFVVLGEDFNENGSERSAIFRFCLDLDLVNLFANYHMVCSMSGFFDTNHNAVLVLIGLGKLLDIRLNSLHKQTGFRNCLSIKLLVVTKKFSGAETYAILKKIVVESVNMAFLRHWFNKFYCFKNRYSSKFFGLELLVAKIVKKFGSVKARAFADLYALLDYVQDCAFSGIMGAVSLSELLLVVNGLLNSKAADLSGIPNEL
ncbi:hypothetical protein G9A89_023099 [Geosiphon pyriformis]|nr:hypothetical protein G9A89_023099 [Geosiphon pyriformis]